MPELQNYLQKAVADHASDLFFIAGCPISEKVDGHILPLEENKLTPADTQGLIHNIYTLSGRSIDRYLETGDDDFSFALPGISRFRVNTYRQRNSFAAVVRVVSFDIPKWEEINIPPQVMDIADITHGMILFTGTAGSGKSTTQACIIDRINRTRDCHIITLEDPIEYVHENINSVIEQRELHSDTLSFSTALRFALRQDPDVIMVGEMRDKETMSATLTAAETGHLVFATIHTNNAPQTIDRIVDSFPTDQQNQVRLQLSGVLLAVLSQRLLPRIDGQGRVAAFELMTGTPPIKALVRDGKTHLLQSTIETSWKDGMCTLDKSLELLYNQGFITQEQRASFRADYKEVEGY